jgi:hypothetical protein
LCRSHALRLAPRDRALADVTDYRFVDFATHGIVHDDVPALSSIALSFIDDRGRIRSSRGRTSMKCQDVAVLAEKRSARGMTPSNGWRKGVDGDYQPHRHLVSM